MAYYQKMPKQKKGGKFMSLLLEVDILGTITGALGMILYPLFSIIFVAIDAVQGIFRAFAGIGNISFGGTIISGGGVGGGEANEQGLVYYLMQHEVVRNMLASIMLLALFLIVIFTVMAALKNFYSAKPKKWQEIVMLAIKGLGNFIFLPVVCLFSVWVGNIILQAIDGATSAGGSVNMSRKLFICCAYDANYYRTGEQTGSSHAKWVAGQYAAEMVSQIQDGQSNEYYAQIIDNIYANKNVNLNWWGYVDDGYSLWQINYLVLIVGGVFILYVLGAISFAMVKRMFYILVLFIVSPGICAMYPLDEGAAVKSWSGEFKKQVLSAYGAVAGLNLFFALLPLIDKIQVYNGVAGNILDNLVQLFVMVSGLLIVKDLIGLISGFVGGDNAYSTGTSLMKASTGAVKKYTGATAKKVSGVHGAFSRAWSAGKTEGFKGWIDSMGHSAKGAMQGGLKTLTGVDVAAYKKTVDEARKDGYEHPLTGLEKSVARRKARNADSATKGAKGSLNAAIKAANGQPLDDSTMAEILKDIKNKDAQKRVAMQMANYNNSLTHHNKNGKVYTADKVLESVSEVVKEESRRQEAYGAYTSFTEGYEEYSALNSELNDKVSDLTRLGIEYNSATGTYSKGVSQAQFEAYKVAASAEGATQAEKDLFNYAAEQMAAQEAHEKIIVKHMQAVKAAKQDGLNVARAMESLAENYKGSDKQKLLEEANALKKVINKKDVKPEEINAAINTTTDSAGKIVEGALWRLTKEQETIFRTGELPKKK